MGGGGPRDTTEERWEKDFLTFLRTFSVTLCQLRCIARTAAAEADLSRKNRASRWKAIDSLGSGYIYNITIFLGIFKYIEIDKGCYF